MFKGGLVGVLTQDLFLFFASRNIKIRPASVKTFDEVMMEDGTSENHEVNY